MRSPDVIAALGNLNKAVDEKAAEGNTLVFELQRYTFQDHGTHLELSIIVRNAEGERFRKLYKTDGSGPVKSTAVWLVRHSHSIRTLFSPAFFPGRIATVHLVILSSKRLLRDS